MCGDFKFFGRAALSRTTILVAAAGPIAIIVDIVAGLWVAGDYQLRAAFGEVYSNTGLVLVFLCFAQLPLCLCGFYGAKSHNKCVLLSHAIYVGCIALTQLLCALIVILGAEPTRNDDFRLACVVMETASTPECREFYRDPLSLRFADLWSTMHQMSRRSVLARLELDQIASDGKCCGFDVPLLCSADRHIPGLAQTTGCSAVAGFTNYYPYSKYCGEAVSEGGCPYDLPVGRCISVEATRFSRGCLVQLHDHLLRKTRPIGYCVLAAAFFQFMEMIITMCYCLKHKVAHSLPHRGWTISEDGRAVFIDGFWKPPEKTVALDNSSTVIDDEDDEELLKLLKEGMAGGGGGAEGGDAAATAAAAGAP